MLTKEAVIAKIKPILDPELGISIVDLGLIYDVKFANTGMVTVVMTLTTIGCPLFSSMADPIKSSVKELAEVQDVEVELTFEPPWGPEKMSDDAKIMLGFM